MGYRSTVTVRTTERNAKALRAAWTGAGGDAGDFSVRHLGDDLAEIRIESYKWDKWSFPEVEAFEECLNRECDGEYGFVRMGDDPDDIEIRESLDALYETRADWARFEIQVEVAPPSQIGVQGAPEDAMPELKELMSRVSSWADGNGGADAAKAVCGFLNEAMMIAHDSMGRRPPANPGDAGSGPSIVDMFRELGSLLSSIADDLETGWASLPDGRMECLNCGTVMQVAEDAFPNYCCMCGRLFRG